MVTVQDTLKLTPQCLEVLEQQEAVLQFDKFGSREALTLGNIIAELAGGYDRGVSAAIIRELDGLTLFQFAMDDKAPRNDTFMLGKRKAALKSGHSSLWAYVKHALTGECEDLFARVPETLPFAGAFPIRVHGEWTATLTISVCMMAKTTSWRFSHCRRFSIVKFLLFLPPLCNLTSFP